MKRTREEFEQMILTHWNLDSVPFYLAEILCGESTIEETIRDLESFERKKKLTNPQG